MNTHTVDVAVVGSGFGAAAPALRLAEAGLDVLILEKGPDVVPEVDFRQTQDPKYLLGYLKNVSSETIGMSYAEALGGGSGFYEMVSLRTPSKAFEQLDENGRRYWPAGVDRATMDRHYDLAERMLNVEQIGLDEIPKSGVAFSKMMKELGYSCDRARYAVKGCVGSGYCVSGCIFGAKQSLHYNYLPGARAAGARVMTSIEVRAIRTRGDDPRARAAVDDIAAIPHRYELLCRTKDGESVTVRAKIVVLGGGTVGTAALLMASRSNLPFLSDHVGRNISFNGSVKAAGLLPDGFVEGDMLSGRSHPGMISYHFFDRLGITISSAKPLPLQVVAAAHLYGSEGSLPREYWGADQVELMKLYRRRMIVLYALGLTRPCAELRRSGSGKIEPHLTIDEELRAYYRQTKELLNSIFTRNGCSLLKVKPIDGEGTEYEGIRFETTHMIGSCRMAESKQSGVVDAFGEVFDYPGLYVSDGAAIPSSLAVNSSLTILANAERIAAHLVRRHGRRDVARVEMPVVGSRQPVAGSR